MSNRSSNRIKRLSQGLLLAGVFAALAAPAFASKKDDDYKKAQQAVAAGDTVIAARLFCGLADEDPKFKDVVTQCETYKNENIRRRNLDGKRLEEARQAIKAGRLDDAEDLLKKIKIPDLAEQAKDELARIASLRNEQNVAAASASADHNFRQAVQAYDNNEFPRARELFSGVSGTHAAEARGYVEKMNNYQRAMGEARRLMDAKDYKGAAAMFQEAASIKPDGPNDPRGNAAQMSQLANQPAAGNTSRAAAPPPSAPANPTPRTIASAPAPSPSRPSSEQKPAAVKAAAPALDTAKLMREGDAARAKGDVGTAKGKYIAILAADSHNAAARSALDEVAKASAGSTQSAGAEADVMLAKAIGEFYNGQLEQADVHINDYLGVNGAKTGLAYFYQGASKVMRYYLSGAQDRQLKDDARTAFLKAKQVANFHPPDKQLVSPRVVSAYEEAR